MRESSTYMAILEEGAVEHAQKMLLLQGTAKYGEPNELQAGKLKAI